MARRLNAELMKKNWINANNKHHPLSLFFDDSFQFRLKPRTITINGIEVPTPFEPEIGERYCYLWDCQEGYSATSYKDSDPVVIGAWRTEDEIKQVVEALRSIFK